MNQVVEMGKASCSTFGCGEVRVEQTPMGTRCRNVESGSYVPCPAGAAQNPGMGFFLKQDGYTGKGQIPWGKLPGPEWSAITTPNVRYPRNPVAKRTAHALKRSGVEKYEARYPGQVRMLFSGSEYQRSPAENAAKRRIEQMMRQEMLPTSRYGAPRSAMMGVGRFGAHGIGASYGPFDFDMNRAMALTLPQMVQPHHLVIGNIAGGFVPGVVNYAINSIVMPDFARAVLRFGLAASGAVCILFGRRNGYLFGAGLALLPQTVTALITLMRSLTGSRAAPAPQAPPSDGTIEGVGQWLPEEKVKLQKAAQRAFGVDVQGAKNVGVLSPVGFETITPDDFGALSDAAVMVAGLGANPYKPIGS
jgi:hypothetical protein